MLVLGILKEFIRNKRTIKTVNNIRSYGKKRTMFTPYILYRCSLRIKERVTDTNLFICDCFASVMENENHKI